MIESKATRVRHALGAPSRLLRLLLVGVLTACTAGDSPFMPGELSRSPLRIQPRFAASVVGSSLAASVNQVALTARNAANRAVLGVDTISVAALTDVIESPLEITLPSGTTSLSVIVTLEYLQFTPPSSFTVLFSGETAPITVNAGGTTQVPPPEVYPGPPSNLTITAVSVDPNAVTIDESASRALHATAEGASGEADIFWRVIDGNAVELSSVQGSDIMVEGVAPGVSRVEAAAGPRADTVEVTVLAIPASVAVSPDSLVVTTLGEVAAYTATVRDARGAEMADVPVSWTVVDGTVAESNGDGSFSARARGRTTVAAAVVAHPDITGSALLVVEPVATVLAIDPAAATLQALGDTAAFTALAADGAGNPVAVAVTWSITPDTVASIDANGRAVALRRGTAQVTASGAGLTATATLSVIPAPATITLAPSDTTLVAIGATAQLRAAAADANGNALTPAFTWSTSDTDIATVSATGLVTARGDGTATITATAGGVSATATVHVDLPAPPPPPPPAAANLVMRTPVISADLIRSGDSATFTFVVVNNGGTAAAATSLHLELFEHTENVSVEEDTTIVLPAIEPGDSVVVSFHDEFELDLAPPSITMHVRATVDPEGAVAESSEDDNSAESAPFTFLGPASIEVTPSSLEFTALGDSTQLTWVVKDLNGEVLPVDHVQVIPQDLEGGVFTNPDGWVYAFQPDTTAVLVVAGTVSSAVPVVVTQLPDTLIVPEILVFGQIGDPQTVHVALLDANGVPIPVDPVLTSANPAIVEIVDDSTARALAEGETEITVQAGGLEAVIAVSVMPTIDAVDVLEDTLSFAALGDTTRITVTVRDAGGSPLSVPPEYTTRDIEVAGVDNGLVTAVGNGATWVVAFAGESAADSVLVTVQQVADSLSVFPQSLAFGAIEQQLTFSAQVFDRNGFVTPYVPDVVPESNGVVDVTIGDTPGTWIATATAFGSSLITVSFDTLEAVIAVESHDDAAPASIVFNLGEAILLPGDSLIFNALTATQPITGLARDRLGNDLDVTVSLVVRPDTAVSLSENVITAVRTGRGWLVGSAGPASDSIEVVVRQVPSSVQVELSNSIVEIGSELTVAATAAVLDALGSPIDTAAVWSTSDAGIATVGETDGVVTPLQPGIVDIIASVGELRGAAQLEILGVMPDAIVIAPETLTFSSLLDTLAVTVTVMNADSVLPGAPFVLEISNGDPTIAQVVSGGVVSLANGGGFLIAHAAAGTVRDSIPIIVDQVAAALDVNLSAAEVAIGGSITVTALAHDSTGHPMSPVGISWTSSNTPVATVASDGTVTAGLTTGTAIITGTLDGVQAADTLLVTVAVDGFTKVWVGGGLTVDASTEFGIASTEPDAWGNAGNWSPAGVPASSDIVLIAGGSGLTPTLYADHEVLDLTVETDAEIRLNGHDLTVLRDLRADGRLANASTNGRVHACANPGVGRGKVRGIVPGLRIAGLCDVDASIEADSIDVDGGELDVKGGSAKSNGRFTTRAGGRLRMNSGTDVLEASDIEFGGRGIPGYLASGRIIAHGNLKQVGACGADVALQAEASHTIEMRGTGKRIELACTDAAVGNLDIGASAIVNLADMPNAGALKVKGRLDARGVLQHDGNGVVEVDGEVRAHGGNGRIALSELRAKQALVVDAANTTGTTPMPSFDVLTTTFTGTNQVIPTAHGHLKNVTVQGTAEVTGDATTTIGGNLVVTGAGAKLKMPASASGQANVTGALSTTSGGAIEMTSSTHTLIVNGDVTLSGGAGVLQAGTIQASGNLTVGGTCPSAVSSAHRIELTGSTAALSSSCRLGSLSASSASDVTLASDLDLAGALVVSKRITGVGRKVSADSTVIIAAGAEFVARELEVAQTLTVDASATAFAVDTTTFDGAGAQSIPAVTAGGGYQKLKINKSSGTATPVSALTAQDVIVSSGSLSIVQPITVTNNFTTVETGTLIMTDTDVLTVDGDAVFAGGPSTSLNNGVLKVGKKFVRAGSCGTTTFAASGLHIVELTGTLDQTIEISCVDVGGSGESGPSVSASMSFVETPGVQFATLVTAASVNTNFVNSTATDEIAADTIRIRGVADGTVPVRVTGTLTDASLVDGGGWMVDLTRVDGAKIVATGLATNMTVLATPTLPPALAVTGNVTVEAGDLEINSNTLTVSGSFATTGSGALSMTLPTGVLDVSGNAAFAGGSTNGRLTAGLLKLGGNFEQTGACGASSAAAFTASSDHQVELIGSAPQSISFACPDTSLTALDRSRFNKLKVSTSRAVTFVTNSAIAGDLSIVVPENTVADSLLVASADIEVTVECMPIGTNNGRWRAPTRVRGSSCTAATMTDVRQRLRIAGSTYQLGGNTTFHNDVIVRDGGVLDLAGFDAVFRQNLETNATGVIQLDAAADSAVVEGNLLLAGGESFVTAGTLDVKGTLTTSGSGALRMDGSGAKVLVLGEATFDGGTSALSAGTLELRAGLTQLGTCSETTFLATGTHLTRFTGSGTHEIDFACSSTTASRLADVSLASAKTIKLAGVGDLVLNNLTVSEAGVLDLVSHDLKFRDGGSIVVPASRTATIRLSGHGRTIDKVEGLYFPDVAVDTAGVLNIEGPTDASGNNFVELGDISVPLGSNLNLTGQVTVHHDTISVLTQILVTLPALILGR